MSSEEFPLPNLADEMQAQKDAVSLMISMAAETENKVNKLMAISDKFYLAHSSLQDVAVSFDKFFRKAQFIYRGLLIAGIAVCLLATGLVFYSIHSSAQLKREHMLVLDSLRAEYAETGKKLQDEVDQLQGHLIEKYREHLNALQAAHTSEEQALKKSYDENLRSLAAGHNLEVQALQEVI